MSLQLYNLSGAKVSEVSETKDCEYGSNSIGTWEKYANGKLVQYGRLQFNAGEQSKLLTFPLPFNNNTYLMFLTSHNINYVDCVYADAYNQNNNIYIYASKFALSNLCQWMAIGTWK